MAISKMISRNSGGDGGNPAQAVVLPDSLPQRITVKITVRLETRRRMGWGKDFHGMGVEV